MDQANKNIKGSQKRIIKVKLLKYKEKTKKIKIKNQKQ